MAMQVTNREKLAFKLDHLTDSEIEEVAEYVSIMETMSRQRRQPDRFEDELLASLSAAYENRRARQVVEWEAVRRSSEMKAAKARSAHR